MFARMLRRPRNQHGHERVSLQEETNTDDPDVQASAEDDIYDADERAEGTNSESAEHPETEQSESDNITLHPPPTTHPFLTSQIAAERHIRHRRQSTCTLLLLFLLFRLWVEAIIQKDVGLLFLSTMGTTWTYRWWSLRRAEEDEYDRQIEENGRNTSETNAEGQSDAASTFDPDLGLMSFQAQLALAILESQRQMFENGGYGGNDAAHNGPGVTDEAKAKWKKYEWGGEECGEIKRLASNSCLEGEGNDNNVTPSRPSTTTTIQRSGSNGSNYGSVNNSPTGSLDERGPTLLNNLQNRDLSPSKLEEGLVLCLADEEEPSCSICLCEYEKGESVTRLPCHHIYHESCLDSWITNHVRCPLCNYDLMEGFEVPLRPSQQQHQNNNQDLFRRMMGVRRASARSARRQLASMLAAMEDNVV